MAKFFNSVISFFLSPHTFLLLNLLMFLLAYCCYKYNIDVSIANFYVSPLYFLYPILLYISRKYKSVLRFDEDLSTDNKCLRNYAKLVLAVNCLEYAFFGIPLLSLFGIGKHIIYADYGFPLLHHIAVSSWIFIFVSFKKQWINYIAKLYAVLNPFLIINRDLMLLTFFCCVVYVVSKNKKSKMPFLIFVLIVIAFGALGNLRSGKALNVTPLPIKIEFLADKSILKWLFVYATSSYFNFLNNIFSKNYHLQVSNINVFPECFYWYVSLDVFGMIIFYIIIFTLLLLIAKNGKRKISFRFFYVFFLYETIMTLFGRKVFVTHTVYQLAIFTIIDFLINYSFLFCRTPTSPSPQVRRSSSRAAASGRASSSQIGGDL